MATQEAKNKTTTNWAYLRPSHGKGSKFGGKTSHSNVQRSQILANRGRVREEKKKKTNYGSVNTKGNFY